MIPSGAVDVLGAAWNDPASLGYPAVFGLVLLGSVVPVVPTGLVVGGGAAVAVSSGALSLPLVVLLSARGAFFGDVLTFALCRFGGPAAVRWVARGQQPTGSPRSVSSSTGTAGR
jgi:membrane protein DedA with SNARE-associated domain